MKDWELLATEAPQSVPSLEDGMSNEAVRSEIVHWCQFIDRVGANLRPKLKPLSRCTAKFYLHRFYSRKSLKDYDSWVVATTIIILAAKVEEDMRKMRDILDTAYYLKTGKKERLSTSNEEKYLELREQILIKERILMQTLDFNLGVVQPHTRSQRFIAKYLVRGSHAQGDWVKPLKNKAWQICTIQLMGSLCLRYNADQIAAASVTLAIREQAKIGLLQPDPATGKSVRVIRTEGREQASVMYRSTEKYFEQDKQLVNDIVVEMLELTAYLTKMQSEKQSAAAAAAASTRGVRSAEAVRPAATSTAAAAPATTRNHTLASSGASGLPRNHYSSNLPPSSASIGSVELPPNKRARHL